MVCRQFASTTHNKSLPKKGNDVIRSCNKEENENENETTQTNSNDNDAVSLLSIFIEQISSPLKESLPLGKNDLPPALFSVGTEDALLYDTLLMECIPVVKEDTLRMGKLYE